MKKTTVSIIIPAFNEEKYLLACLDSILNMDYPSEHVEVIVIDNGSADLTRNIARSRGVRVFRDDSLTVSGLRNLGARHSEGEILAFVDADCVVSKDWLDNAMYYCDHGDVAAWGGPPVLPDDSTWVQQTWYLIRKKENNVQEVEWLESMNLFVRREQFLAIGGFNEELVTCEDVDLSYRISQYGKIVSDSRIEVIHMGEAATLGAFFRKEIWRGKGNLQGIRSHGFSVKELPSLFIPLYFGILLPAICIMAFLLMGSYGIVPILLTYSLPSVAVLYKMRKKKIGVIASLRLLLLVQIYFWARTIAVLKNQK